MAKNAPLDRSFDDGHWTPFSLSDKLAKQLEAVLGEALSAEHRESLAGLVNSFITSRRFEKNQKTWDDVRKFLPAWETAASALRIAIHGQNTIGWSYPRFVFNALLDEGFKEYKVQAPKELFIGEHELPTSKMPISFCLSRTLLHRISGEIDLAISHAKGVIDRSEEEILKFGPRGSDAERIFFSGLKKWAKDRKFRYGGFETFKKTDDYERGEKPTRFAGFASALLRMIDESYLYPGREYEVKAVANRIKSAPMPKKG